MPGLPKASPAYLRMRTVHAGSTRWHSCLGVLLSYSQLGTAVGCFDDTPDAYPEAPIQSMLGGLKIPSAGDHGLTPGGKGAACWGPSPQHLLSTAPRAQATAETAAA